MFIFPTLFINDFVKNTEAVNEGIKVINNTSTSVELQAWGLNGGIDYRIDIGNLSGPFISEGSTVVAQEDFMPSGKYNWTVNHPSSYAPGTEYKAALSRINPPAFDVASAFIVIPKNTGGGPTTGGGDGGPTTGGGLTINTTINNPLGSGINDIPSFIEALVNIVLIVGIPIVALAIIYTGFLFVGAQGNPDKITKAKKALVYTLIGGALLLGAFVIAKAIGATVEDIKSTT